jgi:hypothetical protein
MAYQRPMGVDLGPGATGLAASLYYQVVSLAGSVLVARTNARVTEQLSGSGIYRVDGGVAWDPSWSGHILWDETTLGVFAAEDFTADRNIPPTAAEVRAELDANSTQLALILGLAGHNRGLRDLTWDGKNLLTATLCLYDTAAHALLNDGSTGLISSYHLTNTYDSAGRQATEKRVEV